MRHAPLNTLHGLAVEPVCEVSAGHHVALYSRLYDLLSGLDQPLGYATVIPRQGPTQRRAPLGTVPGIV
jgi:hypothetical protein